MAPRLTPARLRAWREARGWTQQQAAEWYGSSREAWQSWELGRRPIPRPLAIRIVAESEPRPRRPLSPAYLSWLRCCTTS